MPDTKSTISNLLGNLMTVLNEIANPVAVSNSLGAPATGQEATAKGSTSPHQIKSVRQMA